MAGSRVVVTSVKDFMMQGVGGGNIDAILVCEEAIDVLPVQEAGVEC